MDSKYMKITVLDGEQEVERTVRLLPADVMRAERLAGATANSELALAIAYFVAKRNGFAGDDFEAWADTFVGLEEVPDPKVLALN